MASANVTFRYKEHESPPYIEIDGLDLDTKYRILPDAVVATERINGMQTMWIVGWQADRKNKGQFGSSHYSKDEALYFRTELNPVVGETKKGFFRSAGHKIYEHQEGDKVIRYFLNSKGTQKTVPEDEVDFHPKKSYDSKMELQVPGERPQALEGARTRAHGFGGWHARPGLLYGQAKYLRFPLFLRLGERHLRPLALL